LAKQRLTILITSILNVIRYTTLADSQLRGPSIEALMFPSFFVLTLSYYNAKLRASPIQTFPIFYPTFWAYH